MKNLLKITAAYAMLVLAVCCTVNRRQNRIVDEISIQKEYANKIDSLELLRRQARTLREFDMYTDKIISLQRQSRKRWHENTK